MEAWSFMNVLARKNASDNEENEDTLHRHHSSLTTSSEGGSRITENAPGRKQEDFRTSRLGDTSNDVNITLSENLGFVTADENITNVQSASLRSALPSNRDKLEDAVLRASNQVIIPGTETSWTRDINDVTSSEESATEVFTRESVPQNVSPYDWTPKVQWRHLTDSYRLPGRDNLNVAERPVMAISNSTFTIPYKYHLPHSGVSGSSQRHVGFFSESGFTNYTQDEFTNYTQDGFTSYTKDELTNYTQDEFTNYTQDGFTHYIRNGFTNYTQDEFTNYTHNLSWLSNFNAELVYRKPLPSDEPTSFTFDLASWLTLTPPGIADGGVDISAGTSVTVLKVFLLALISLVGALGNVMVIWSVVKERHLHRPPFYFLLSLGVTDLSRAVFCVPVVITTVLHGSHWRHGESACKLFAFATSFFVFSSALSLLAIAIDRHISIVYSKTYRRRAPGLANLVVAVIIWVIAFSVSFPAVVGVGEYVFIPDEAQCAYQHRHYTLNSSVPSVLIFIAILFLTYFFYFRIFRFLRAHRRMRPLQHTPAMSSSWAFVGPGANGQAFINWLNGFGGQVPVRQGGQRAVQRLNFGRVVNLSTAKSEHLTRLFLLVTMTFGLMWLPHVVLSLWQTFFHASVISSLYVTTAAWMGYGQLALCPVVYFLARGALSRSTREVYSHAEKRSFLLENKTGKR